MQEYAQNHYRNLSENEKEKKKKHGRDCYLNISKN